jgi:hypothetical protein
MIGWTYHALAAVTISATIEAPPLLTQATITSPTDGTVTTQQIITASGTCPPQSYIALSVNNLFSGVAWCNSQNEYSIVTSVNDGTNTLNVQDYNTTNEPGPTSKSLQVVYTAPVVPQQSSTTISSSDGGVGSEDSVNTTIPAGQSTDSTAATATPMVLSSSFQFYTFKPSAAFSWKMELEGGEPPYDVNIDWGDGTTSHLYFPTDPTFWLKHTYLKEGYYAIQVHSTDRTAIVRNLQLAALITGAKAGGPFPSDTPGSTQGVPPPPPPLQPEESSLAGRLKGNFSLFMLVWPTYGIVALMTVSFWLGERQLAQARRRGNIRNKLTVTQHRGSKI